ncbi:MAG TPA: efflux RND transporter permease subunit [Spirochaetota bacterium]|nr:efflux RND transporter permease subunit [Spirochaetota bacterium]HPJ35542.1 efflux RND transporter permease subunit [Spirochaetota bacterium]
MEKIVSFFVKDKLIVNIILLTVLVVGVASAFNIKRETMPATDIDRMIIRVAYPGASPEDVELNAVVPVEDTLNEINGIEEYKSVSIDGGAVIIVSIDQDVSNKQKIKDEVFRKVSKSNIDDIPDDVDDIQVHDMNTSHKSIIQIGLSIKDGKATKRELYAVADQLQSQLKRLNGVSEVDMNGYLDREIHINVNPDKMDKYYVSLNDLIQSIQYRNVRASGGTIQSVYYEKNIVTVGQFDKPADVGEVIVRSGFEQRKVRIKDVASIEDGFEDEDIKVNVNGESSVIFIVRKKEDADIIKTVDGVKKYIESHKKIYGEKFDFFTVADDSESVKSLIGVVITNATIGFILVFLVLLIFLDLNTSFWTAMGIPVSLLLTIIFMRSNDFSLNIMTLGGIITVLGMLVDDAIVVAENVYEKKNQGIPAMEAAITGVKEVFAPVLVSVLTTVLAFLPILLIKGTMGKFIYSFPLVISAALLFSIFESTTLLPNHLAYSHIKVKEDRREHWFRPLVAFYEKVLRKALGYRYFILGFFLVLFAFSVVFSNETIKGFVLFWDNSNEYVNIDISLDPGTSLEKTEEKTLELRKLIVGNIPEQELVSTYSRIGTHSSRGSTDHEYWSTIQIKLVPINDRERTAGEIVNDLRRKIPPEALKGFVSVVMKEQKGGPPTGEPVDIKVVSRNSEEAKTVMRDLMNTLEKIDGVKDVDSDLKEGKRELRFKFDYSKMAQYELDVKTISSAVRAAYAGSTATSIQTVESKLDFVVRLEEKSRGSEAHLMNLLIPNSSGRLIRLKEVARLTSGSGESEINHFNGDRTISVTADVDISKTTPVKVQKQIKDMQGELLSKYPNTYLLFEGEAKESGKTMSDMAISFMVALFLIYLLIVLQFRSFVQPLVVMCVIPFGLIGVLIAFTLHSVPLSFMGVIGVIGLSGVVVNDSILMVNFINREKGRSESVTREKLFDNVAGGASQRLRAIVLTTITTVAGLMPTVYGIGGNALTLVPTVMAMAYGLLFATTLTLVFVPCLYMINEDIKMLAEMYIKKIVLFKRNKA